MSYVSRRLAQVVRRQLSVLDLSDARMRAHAHQKAYQYDSQTLTGCKAFAVPDGARKLLLAARPRRRASAGWWDSQRCVIGARCGAAAAAVDSLLAADHHSPPAGIVVASSAVSMSKSLRQNKERRNGVCRRGRTQQGKRSSAREDEGRLDISRSRQQSLDQRSGAKPTGARPVFRSQKRTRVRYMGFFKRLAQLGAATVTTAVIVAANTEVGERLLHVRLP